MSTTWDGPNPPGDKPELIKRCLTCEKESCDNCLSLVLHNPGKIPPIKNIDLEVFTGLYNKGFGLNDLAAAVGVTTPSLIHSMRRRGIPTGRKNRIKIAMDMWDIQRKENTHE